MKKKLTFGLAAAVALGLSRTNPPEAVKEDFARRRDAIDEAAASMDARVQAEDKRADTEALAASFTAAVAGPVTEIGDPSGHLGTGRIFSVTPVHASAKTRRPGENRAQHRARVQAQRFSPASDERLMASVELPMFSTPAENAAAIQAGEAIKEAMESNHGG